MSTAATAAIVAANSANISSANTRRQKHECESFMDGYVHEIATTGDIQAYAECADLLYPQAESDYSGVAILFLISVVIGVIGGVFHTFKDRDLGLGILGGALWFLITWCVYIFVTLIALAIQYLM
ncbi:MAG: hypothetical protein P3W91_002945 [Fervidobacterium sp.]|nr:hypothetical protein [Fervidobacterium sp.]